eukprot:2357979-Pleurochrysis_carterae.AAC.1
MVSCDVCGPANVEGSGSGALLASTAHDKRQADAKLGMRNVVYYSRRGYLLACCAGPATSAVDMAELGRAVIRRAHFYA